MKPPFIHSKNYLHMNLNYTNLRQYIIADKINIQGVNNNGYGKSK